MYKDKDSIIQKAILSEKSYASFEKGVYTLQVALKATKEDIRKALKKVFNVDAVRVNTSILRGDVVRRARSKKSGAVSVKLPNVKKAMIRLKDGQVLPQPVWGAPESSVTPDSSASS